MLPSRHGDGLWIEWGVDQRRRMIIDGGTKAAFGYIRERLEELPEEDREIELLVITHIDLDHIEAPIELLRTPVKGVTLNDVWFNDHHHLDVTADGTTATRGPKQGEFLAALLEQRGHDWNRAFGGGAVVVNPTGPLPEIKLEGGLALTLLSPTPPKLQDLQPDWTKEIEQADFSPGDRARALQLLEQKMGPIAHQAGVGASRGGGKWGVDHSAANGSSIAFIAQYGQERWLFGADAHEDVLRAGLKRYANHHDIDGPIPLTGFKIPHHGSRNNMSTELLSLIDCSHYLISTNGAYFQHPDADCIDLIVKTSAKTEGKTRLAFNYRTPFTERWLGDKRASSTFDFGPDHEPLGHTSVVRTESLEAVTETPVQEESAIAASVRPRDADEAQRLELRVYHGSFERANRPVMLGHYEGTPLSGAEGYVDRRFGGRLSQRFATGGYPGAIGTHLHVKAPPGCHPRNGVLIVGLGQYGELTPLLLAETVQAALVDHALEQYHDSRDWSAPEADTAQIEHVQSIGSVLIGATGDQGIGIRASALAIVKGAADANRFLAGHDQLGSARCRYGSLQFWENRAPSAELALLSLHPRDDDEEVDTNRYDPNALPEGTVIEPTIIVSDGALSHSVPTDDEERTWRRVTVTVDDPTDGVEDSFINLRFTSDSRRAGIGSEVHAVERRRLERLLASAASTTTPAVSLYTTLYELLLPQQLKWELRSAADVKLVVDAKTADIPWEMLSARNPRSDGRQALALRAQFTRQLGVHTGGRVDRAANWRALVIGNPPCGPEWPTLPGAYDEAAAVAATLELSGGVVAVDRHLFEPNHGVNEDATADIEAAFFEDDYRIVHIAGHGVFDEDDPARTGVVIGPDVYVTAQFIGQLNPVPDVVFLNCCHLGTVAAGHSGPNSAAGEFNRLGASLAQRLIDSGVRAVIAAGWAVDDVAATAFATTFYEQLARAGATFGEAVFAARQAAFRSSPDSSTWGAYQCYGDSDLRLRTADRSPVPRLPLTVREMLRRIEELLERMASQGSASMSSKQRENEVSELKALTMAFNNNGWLLKDEGGHVAEQLARVHAEMNELEPAIAWFDEAIGHPDGAATLRSVKHRAELRDRYARHVMAHAKDKTEARLEAIEILDAAETDIDWLVSLQQTEEHWRLLGDHHKRRATIMPAQLDRDVAIQRSLDAYLKAWERSRELQKQGWFSVWYDPEPHASVLAKYIQLEAAVGRLRAKPHPTSMKRLLRALKVEIGCLLNWPTSHAGYRHSVCLADCRLAQAMARGDLPKQVDELTALYLRASRTRSSTPDRQATSEHLEDLELLHVDAAQRDALASITKSLDADYEARITDQQ